MVTGLGVDGLKEGLLDGPGVLDKGLWLGPNWLLLLNLGCSLGGWTLFLPLPGFLPLCRLDLTLGLDPGALVENLGMDEGVTGCWSKGSAEGEGLCDKSD